MSWLISDGICERRSEVFVKFQKKKKNSGGGGGGGVEFRVDVNAMLGVGGDVGYWGCEPRIEGIVQCTKRYCTSNNIKKIKTSSPKGNDAHLRTSIF